MRPLPAADEPRPFAEVQVREVEAHTLREADAGAVERLEERAVPLTDSGRGGRCPPRGDTPPACVRPPREAACVHRGSGSPRGGVL